MFFIIKWITVLGSGSVLWPAGLGGTLFLKQKSKANTTLWSYFFE